MSVRIRLDQQTGSAGSRFPQQRSRTACVPVHMHRDAHRGGPHAFLASTLWWREYTKYTTTATAMTMLK